MPKKIDYTGFENEYLKIISIADESKQDELNKNNKTKHTYWEYRCKGCGNISYVSSQNVKKIKSCGCSRKFKNVDKRIGMKFGKLTILQFDYDRSEKARLEGHNYIYYICQCECGSVRSYNYNALNCGSIKSCGCGKFNNPLTVKDLAGQKFNRLTVLKRDIKGDKKRLAEKGYNETH